MSEETTRLYRLTDEQRAEIKEGLLLAVTGEWRLTNHIMIVDEILTALSTPVEEWEPVEDNLAVVDTSSFYRGSQQQGNKMRIFDDNKATAEWVNLPDNIRLCRKVTP